MSYGTVGKDKETVAFHEETVAFKRATDWLKTVKNLDFGIIANKIGLTRSQMQMLRIYRRKATNQDIDNLLQHYPEVSEFFAQASESDKMIYPSNFDSWQELAVTQKKLILQLEKELNDIRLRLIQLEAENKVLKEITSQK